MNLDSWSMQIFIVCSCLPFKIGHHLVSQNYPSNKQNKYRRGVPEIIAREGI